MITTLIAVDGSEHSLRAVESVCRLAAAGLVMDVHVLNVQIPVESGHVRMFVEADMIEDYYRQEGLAALKDACGLLDGAGIKYTRHIAVGHIANTIAHYATKLQAEQVVMGSHGRGALKHMLMGSVASDVIRQAGCAVTLVR
ncbi:MAG: universal stress protein [Zoogloea sp.]|jgi:nucleotide-binding universal stress UspA family protein|nr:universal stress protein [Zoogloea sp.]